MSGGIAELIATMAEKKDALDCLRVILEEEKELIIGLESEKLQINSSRKLHVFEKITALSSRCRAALDEACREAGVAGGDALSPLINGLKKPEKDQIRALQSEILGAARENERLLALNKGLLENSLRLVDRSLNFFSKFLTSANTYGEAGRIVELPLGARLVCKEI